MSIKEEIPDNEKADMEVSPKEEKLPDEKGSVVVTDTDLFGEHMDNRISELREKQEGEDPDDEELVLQDCTLLPLHLACADVDTGNHRLIEIKNNIATATNASILVKIDLSLVTSLTKDMLKKLDGKFIHMSVWQEMSKCDMLRIDDDLITVHKAGINKMFEYSSSQGTFFNTNHIVGDLAEAGEDKKRIMFCNVSLISTVAKIFKTDNLHFSFNKGDNKGIFVFPYHGCGMFGIIMPLLDDKVENRYFFT